MAFHASETINPEKTYKKAILWTGLIILSMSILGTLAITFVMPSNSPDLIGGIVQSLTVFLGIFHLKWMVPVIALMIAFGVLSEINSWMIGPSKGLLAAAEEGKLPACFAIKNKRGIPVGVRIIQSVFGTLLGSAYIFMPSVNSGYWLLSDLTAQFTIMMWVLLFMSAIVLYYKRRDTQRIFKIPGKQLGIWLTGGVGILTCMVMLVVSYIPPTSIVGESNLIRYELFLVGGLVAFIILPLLYVRFCRKQTSL